MNKEIDVIDLTSKLSANSFLIQTESEKILVVPGVFLGQQGKFYLFVDVLDAIMRNLYVNGKGNVVINIEDLQQSLKPVDLNQFFIKLESTIKNKDVLGIGNENTQENKQYPIGDVKVVEDNKLPQPSTPTIGELKPEEVSNQSEKKESEEPKQTEQKRGYNKTYTNKKNYQKSGYNKTSANGNTSTSGKSYKKSVYNKTSSNRYTKSYKKTYKKSE